MSNIPVWNFFSANKKAFFSWVKMMSERGRELTQDKDEATRIAVSSEYERKLQALRLEVLQLKKELRRKQNTVFRCEVCGRPPHEGSLICWQRISK